MKTMPSLTAALAALLVPVTSPAATAVNSGTVTQISGPAGIDLAGEITHAINFSANDGPLIIQGVKFIPDTALPPGQTVGPNSQAPWQVKPVFGSTRDENNLEEIYQDIRWANNAAAPTPQTLQAHLPVTAGETYQIQILFYGNISENRRWDISVEGNLVVDEISSLGLTTGGSPGTLPPYLTTAGIVYTVTVTAADSTLDIVMGNLGGAFEAGDRNPVWQGLVVEHVVPDSEPDGLPDAWEIASFGTTDAQTGAGDADSDGLSNQLEYQLGTNPGVADSDNDGLSDSQEYLTTLTGLLVPDTDADGLTDGAEITAGTNPFITDSDSDGLTDGNEVNTSLTNPLDRDSDDDDYLDGGEVSSGSNPNNPASYPLYSTQIHAITGGDQGEGLDFTGTFKAAARFGVATLSGSWPVREATFLPYHSVPGLTHNSTFQADAWITMAFPGPLSAADTNLATVMRSIRYQSSLFTISLSGLTVGRSYKLQLMFGEACCPARGFDVYVENTLVADEFSPPAIQGGAATTFSKGAAIVYGFVATDTSLDIRLDKSTVTTPTLTDINPILNALSLEEIPAGADTDTDGLPDAWEITNFGNITAQASAGDPDSDGLPNSDELTRNTNPNNADTDNDGLQDGAEVNTTSTNPRLADTDNDGLSDGAEVNTHLTNPNNPDSDRDTLLDGPEVNIHGSDPRSIDSDNDGFNDPTEILNGTNPASLASKPGDTHRSRVLGADASEGLDLFGDFLYAFNVGSPGAAGMVHDANFTSDSGIPGVTVAAPNDVPAWFAPEFGSSSDDTNLEFVFQSIRWADVALAAPNNHVSVSLTGLTPGRSYKLQLLFAESCCPGRYFDVSVDGNLLADEFNPSSTQGSNISNVAGAAIVHTFTAASSTVTITCDGTTTLLGTDHNATLSGVTLEALVNTVPLEITAFTPVPGGYRLDVRGTPSYAYSVDWSPDLVTWEEINDSLTPGPLGNASWTDMDITRVGPLVRRGFYKVRDPALDPTP